MTTTISAQSSSVSAVTPLVEVLRNQPPWLSGAHPNVLLVGDTRSIDWAVNNLESIYQSPVVETNCGGLPLTLPPSGSASTVIVHDVATLSLEEQQLLSDWLSRENGRTQVVTTSSVPLFPLVERGAFLATLYYRLNVLYAEVTPAP